jgi:putative IMPACT (imprinted ancient) family translation regulator
MKTIEIDIKTPEEKEKYDEWKIECAYNDLMRAEEIKADKELMAKVAEYAREKLPGKIRSLKELKKIAQMRIKELQDNKDGKE